MDVLSSAWPWAVLWLTSIPLAYVTVHLVTHAASHSYFENKIRYYERLRKRLGGTPEKGTIHGT